MCQPVERYRAIMALLLIICNTVDSLTAQQASAWNFGQSSHLQSIKEFEDDNFQFYEYGGKFLKGVENTVGKGEIARYEQLLLFLQCFQKTCTANT